MWHKIALWYYQNGFFEAAEAAKNPLSDLRRMVDSNDLWRILSRS